MNATYKVLGMTCGGCSRSVTNALQQALPNATIEVDHATDTAKVTGKHDPAKVKEAIEDAGFDFEGPLQG